MLYPVWLIPVRDLILLWSYLLKQISSTATGKVITPVAGGSSKDIDIAVTAAKIVRFLVDYIRTQFTLLNP